jgi:hypothetical protein
MSADRDVTRIVRSWLEEGVTALPDRVLDNVLDQLPATSQRRASWPARRLREMNIPVRIGVAAAAVIALALVGLAVAPRASGPGGPSASTSPSPSRSPSPSSSSAASPVALKEGPLTAGTYIIGPGLRGTWAECVSPIAAGCSNTIGLVFTVPDGWAGVGNDSIWLAAETNAAPAGAGMLFTRGAPLYADPCLAGGVGDSPPPTIPVGPTAGEFASALAAHPLLDVTTPVDVTLAGYSGKYVDLQVPSDITKCPTSYWPWEPGLYAQGPSQRWHLWILDVGGQRLIVQSTEYAGTSAQRRAELQAIVNSVQIQP